MIKLENKYLKVKVSENGAEILSIKKDDIEIMWEADPKYWQRHAPILFPIVGSLKNGEYKVSGKTYKLPQHGFARDKKFEVVIQKEDAITLTLIYDKETLENYPYKFKLDISYRLIDNKIKVTYKVENLDTKEILYSIGGHPGFKINQINDYSLVVNDEVSYFELSGSLIKLVNSKKLGILKCSKELFSKGALVYEPKKNRTIKLQYKGNDYITMRYNDFKIMGIWTKENANAPFICLEPWNGVADFVERASEELVEKDYINKLKIKEKDEVSYEIEIH